MLIMLMSLCVGRVVPQVSPVLTHVSAICRQVAWWQVGIGWSQLRWLFFICFASSNKSAQATFHDSKAEFPDMHGLLRSSLITAFFWPKQVTRPVHLQGVKQQIFISWRVDIGTNEEWGYYFNPFATVILTIMIIKRLSKEFKIVIH